MTPTYTWKINQLDSYPQAEGQAGVVFTIHYSLLGEAVEGEETYSGSTYGSVGVTYDPRDPFTPYKDLTEEKVVGWVKGALGAEAVEAAEAAVAKLIEDQKNPPVVSYPLPWAAEAAV